MKKLKPTPEELEELLKLVHKHNGFIFSDLRIAEQIQRIAKSKGYCVTSDVALTAAYNRQGVIFRIGYILGQRHERAKRAEQERKRAARNGCIFIHRTGASDTADNTGRNSGNSRTGAAAHRGNNGERLELWQK